MEIYKELYFNGTSDNLIKFTEEIRNCSSEYWKSVESDGMLKDYLLFNYIGSDVDKAQLSIHLGDLSAKTDLRVTNIVPSEKSQLSIAEYNSILENFYNNVILAFKKENNFIKISELSSDKFDPLSVISKIALDKLRTFTLAANKSTGASHPCDRARWLEFVCQTVDDEQIFDYHTLSNFLKDKEYWGEKAADFHGVMGHFAWSEEWADILANEYTVLCEVIEFYKNR
ncbi:MAG: hypothetical protein JEZ08_16645 [Clostridiales bacterium]|nr:hypothetical protein [Clostridiales bacterium]